jgi:NUMOD4 motif
MEHLYLPVKSYEGHYVVSDTGLVKSLNRVTCHGRRRKGQVLKQSVIHGYHYVCLSKDGTKSTVRVHRLVAEAFLMNPLDLPDVHHVDHQRNNNKIQNLRWVDAFDNMQAASRAGRLDGQSRGYGWKLTREQVSEIRGRLSRGEKSEFLGSQYGVSGRTIRHISTGWTWNGPQGRVA